MFLLSSWSPLLLYFYFYFLYSSLLLSTVVSWTTITITTTMSASNNVGDMRFGTFSIPASHIFYKSPLGAAAFTNLRPIVPGHVLIIPERCVRTLQELTLEEYVDMWVTVRHVQTALQRAEATAAAQPHDSAGSFEGTTTTSTTTSTSTTLAFNVAVQDGQAAGQSVPHVHVHILPRRNGDFERNDDVYDALETWAPRPRPRCDDDKLSNKLQVLEDEDRVDRTPEQMAQEAALYRSVVLESSSLSTTTTTTKL
jgi:diadenosine tetraphosphate (Ap4A) HIT family hydrolase